MRYSQSFLNNNDDIKIPDNLPDYDELPDIPTYLDNENIDDITYISSESNDINISNNDNNELLSLNPNANSIFPSKLEHKFTPLIQDIPSNILPKPENMVPLTAEEAANWPTPPWQTKDFIEPIRPIVSEVTKYPELFGNEISRNNNYNMSTVGMSYEDKVQLKSKNELRKMNEENEQKALNERKTVKIKKPSLLQEYKWQLFVKGIIVVFCGLIVYKWHYKDIMEGNNNKWGYNNDDSIRNERIKKLKGVKWRKNGDIIHENILGSNGIRQGIFGFGTMKSKVELLTDNDNNITDADVDRVVTNLDTLDKDSLVQNI